VPREPVVAGADVDADVPDRDHIVVFTPSGRRGNFKAGTTVLQAARNLGVDLDSICGGRGICGRCQIASESSKLSGLTATERAYAKRKGLTPGRRLGCAATIHGDTIVDVPVESQVHRPVVRKSLDARPINVGPVVRLCYLELPISDLGDATSEAARAGLLLAKDWQIPDIWWAFSTLQSLQSALLSGDRKITVAVQDNHVIAVWPGLHDRAYGLAVDIGSTTLALYLCDLSDGSIIASSGAMNPQIRFGEDVMSRVSYAMMNEDGAAAMTDAVRSELDRLVGVVLEDTAVTRDEVLNIVLVGNPVMHHLLLGLDPAPLGAAPFALAIDEAMHLPATSLDLNLNSGAQAYVLPCIAGHVGADTAAVILSEQPHKSAEPVLIIDIGTNAEIVLGDQSRLLAASSPTGPAFEGAQISAGQRAAPGAIERVRIDPETLEPKVKVIGNDLWSDDPAFDAQVTGLCGSGIIEVIGEMVLARLVTADGIIDGEMASRTSRIEASDRTFSYTLWDGATKIQVTQDDIRAIQLAKGALTAGWRLLMDIAGLQTVSRTVLSGAFGAHIDPLYAMILGMVPDGPLETIIAAGNAAGTGARLALVNGAARREIEDVVRKVEKIETATEAKFQDHFVDAMAFPNKAAPYTHLRTLVDLPAPVAASKKRRRRR
jgi:uncharacterized 2Fe-2S/4Fe-4S cluster protein (DUF4445 family)